MCQIYDLKPVGKSLRKKNHLLPPSAILTHTHTFRNFGFLAILALYNAVKNFLWSHILVANDITILFLSVPNDLIRFWQVGVMVFRRYEKIHRIHILVGGLNPSEKYESQLG